MRCRLTTEDCHLSLLYIELALVLEGSEVDAAISHMLMLPSDLLLHSGKASTPQQEAHQGALSEEGEIYQWVKDAGIERAEREKMTRTSIHGDTEAIFSSEIEDEAMASDGDDNEVIRSSEDDNADTPETLRQERGSALLTKRSLHRYRSICDTNALLDSITIRSDNNTHLEEGAPTSSKGSNPHQLENLTARFGSLEEGNSKMKQQLQEHNKLLRQNMTSQHSLFWRTISSPK
ncbi:hypothetical protein PROFUN_14591 [Planoprotostelium fungivorum]|uniref:Uncharacterized protein n=1 Tax=Planoprotostelium fungivorum TaxID=1890364 RepID=A0A2P6MZE8_9EUKA|nr:hypothetical protein PROFUN_14591 [Planoprotostelium fungivorum]